jgi:hypothetical protein
VRRGELEASGAASEDVIDAGGVGDPRRGGRQNRELRSEVDGLNQVNKNLERRLAESGEDLNAARTSLRRMIHAENQRSVVD